jgi:hypothetical protein
MREFNFDFDKDRNPGRRPYVVTCLKCGKTFSSADPKCKFHFACKPKPKKYIYPKEFQWGRHIAWARDQQTCQLCGLDFREGGKDKCKHVHHIDQDTMNNNINNLVVLCARCHMMVHSKKLEGKFEFKRDFVPENYKDIEPKTEKVYFKNAYKNKRSNKKKKLFGFI